MNTSQRRHIPASTRGFTLAEVVVAVAAVLILSVAIGQLFSNVQRLIGTSAAIGEVDQTARVVERQLRDDLIGFGDLPAEDTFLAIRSIEIGDVNRNGALDGGETAIYVSEADREADAEAGIDPYAAGSRAITVRFDDLVFIALSTEAGAFYTQQSAGQETSMFGSPRGVVSWGVGLLPAIVPPQRGDEGFDLTDERTFPTRAAVPDGVSPGDPWIEAFGARFSRNEYAADFPLTRHVLLLEGGDAFARGEEGSVESGRAGTRREVAPFAIDYLNAAFSGITDTTEGPDQWILASGGFDGITGDTARVGLIRHGRVDIAAQTVEDLRRYVEGQFDAEEFGEEIPDASPFGREPLGFEPEDRQVEQVSRSRERDAPLWIRRPHGSTASAFNSPAAILDFNSRGVRQAIAGLVTRRLVETSPPVVRRVQGDAEQPEDEFIDVTGVLAAGCSRFEVAWSDGSRLPASLTDTGDIDGELRIEGPDGQEGTDDDIVFNAGDLVWFDRDFTFNDYLERAQRAGVQVPTPPVSSEFSRQRIERNQVFGDDEKLPPYGNTSADNFFPDTIALSGGVPDTEPDASEREYWAIWGFRYPLSNGAFGNAWRKPKLLRIRMTLHDQQDRIEGGKDYEFIVSLELGS